MSAGGSDYQFSESLLSGIREAAERVLPLMKRIRRHLHTNPELSMQELETTRYLKRQLDDLGFASRGTEPNVGLLFDWDSDPKTLPQSRIGLRADIDALPISTTSEASYASRKPGIMHACGHDAHSAILIGAVSILRELFDDGLLSRPISIRGILQPAEETSEGAAFMIRQGAAEDLRALFAVHVDPNLHIGQVASRAGAFTAGCDTIEVTVRGRPGHSARPYQAADAIAAASNWLQQAYAKVPRVHDCREPSVFNIGQFDSGVAPNVVADRAVLTGTIRTVSERVRQLILNALHSLGTAIEASHSCQVSLDIRTHTPVLQNDETITTQAMSAARQLLGPAAVGEIPLPSMGAEDFAFFSREVPCCMFRVGTAGTPQASYQKHCSPLHSSDFDIEEDSLAVGAQLLASFVIQAAHSESNNRGRSRAGSVERAHPDSSEPGKSRMAP